MSLDWQDYPLGSTARHEGYQLHVLTASHSPGIAG